MPATVWHHWFVAVHIAFAVEPGGFSPGGRARELEDLFASSLLELDHVYAAHHLVRTRADDPPPNALTAPAEPDGEPREIAGGAGDIAGPLPEQRYGMFQEAISNLFGGLLPPPPPPPAKLALITRPEDAHPAVAATTGAAPVAAPVTLAPSRRATAFAWWDAYRAIARQWILNPVVTASGDESVDTGYEYDAADAELRQYGWTDNDIAQWGFHARFGRGPASTA